MATAAKSFTGSHCNSLNSAGLVTWKPEIVISSV